jgi:hypothetical protein
MPPTLTKICKRCGLEQPITNYRHPHKEYPEYRSVRCRDCERELDRARYHRYMKSPIMREHLQKRDRKYRKENRERLRKYAREHMRALRRARAEAP